MRLRSGLDPSSVWYVVIIVGGWVGGRKWPLRGTAALPMKKRVEEEAEREAEQEEEGRRLYAHVRGRGRYMTEQ